MEVKKSKKDKTPKKVDPDVVVKGDDYMIQPEAIAPRIDTSK